MPQFSRPLQHADGLTKPAALFFELWRLTEGVHGVGSAAGRDHYANARQRDERKTLFDGRFIVHDTGKLLVLLQLQK